MSKQSGASQTIVLRMTERNTPVIAGAAMLGLTVSALATGHMPGILAAIACLLGVAFMLAALQMALSSRDRIEFDPATRKLLAITRGSRRATWGFDDVLNIGRDLYKDPKTGRIWNRENVLRLKGGQKLRIAGAYRIEQLGEQFGWPYEREMIMAEEPTSDA